MITKGIVQEFIDNYSVRVRLPIFDGSEKSQYGIPNSGLSVATICSLPNANSGVGIGDVVFVGFEDNDLGKPIILGHLYKEAITNTKLNLELNSLTTHSTTTLNEQTWIGDVTPKEISYLKGVDNPIQDQLNYILETLKYNIELGKIEEYEGIRITNLQDTIWDFRDTLQYLPETEITYNINFTVNENTTQYETLTINNTSMKYGNDVLVYENSNWENEDYKNITILGGDDIKNKQLIKFLYQNAIQQNNQGSE